MEKKISGLAMESARPRKTGELKNTELSRGRESLDIAPKDVKCMAEMCRVTVDMVVKAELYESK